MFFKIVLFILLLLERTNLSIFLLFINIFIVYFGKRIFAAFLSQFPEDYNKISHSIKTELFKNLKNCLPDREKLNILEIGGGSGANFEYYPDQCSVEVVEPNPHFAPYFESNRLKFSNLHIKPLKQGYCEDLRSAGFEDDSVDAVVLTLVLCSVEDPQKCLQEIVRVLKPGGKFFYLEHIAAENGSPLHMLQKFFMLGGFWSFLFDGCHTDRETQKHILEAPFSEVDQKKIDLPLEKSPKILPKILLRVLRSHLMGVATK